MQRKCLKAAALVALFAAAPAWAANKCTIDGRVVYQDQPCPGTGMSVAEDMANKQAARERAERAREAAAKNPPKPLREPHEIKAEEAVAAIQRAIDDKVAAAKAKCSSFPSLPAVGMKEEQFLRCTYFGVVVTPERINETETTAGVTKQYVYRTVADIKYLYTRNGVVTGIQR